MRIDHHIYELTAKNTINSKISHKKRQGALIRIFFDDSTVGYADCHPWVELGDENLDTQLALLKNGQTTHLTKKSLEFARLDAIARAKKVNLFQDLTIPQSHYLVSNVLQVRNEEILHAIGDGFNYFKVKLGAQLELEVPKLIELLKVLALHKGKIRLDFNCKLNEADFENLLLNIQDYLAVIDFYEDPFIFDKNKWQKMQQEYQIALACDNKSEQAIGVEKAAKVIVIKPAIQSIGQNEMDLTGQRTLFTSYLDHPVGQLFAAYTAAMMNCDDICGLVSHKAYETHAFSERLGINHARLVPPQGYGIGFDDLLEKIPWKPL